MLGLYEEERLGLPQYAGEESDEETYWETLDADLRYWTRSLRLVQVYIRCALVESISRHFYSLPYFALKIANVHLCHSIGTLQWYPGHIAKTEKELKEQLRLMDVVIEIRDARIPLSTSHPKVIL